MWKWELPNSKEISAALYAYDFDFNLWTDFSRDIKRLVQEGIGSLSLNPDTVVETWLYLAREAKS